MGLERIEVGIGPVDGLNLSFSTSIPYTPGTVRVFWNGRARQAVDADGWVEVSPALGTVNLNRVPQVGDVIQIFFVDTLPTTIPDHQVICFSGVLIDSRSLGGVLQDVMYFSGVYAPIIDLQGTLKEEC